MYKDYELTVEPGITATNPTEFIKTFPPCVIERAKVTFPKGPNREVYVKVMHEREHVFPFDPQEWVNGEDETVTMIGPWQNWDGLYRLRILLCSPGARLSHKIIFRFELSEIGTLAAIRELTGRLTARFLPVPE